MGVISVSWGGGGVVEGGLKEEMRVCFGKLSRDVESLRATEPTRCRREGASVRLVGAEDPIEGCRRNFRTPLDVAMDCLRATELTRWR